ncbi:MAG: tetratricopeptide repeat protein [Gammaproteobacteria bacterium]|nr:tetratricopeptide repeat protein [Gammaproteobacteria bacterium]
MRLLFLLVLLFAAVFLGLQLHNDPGFVLISTQTWTIETPLWVTVILLISAFFLLHFFYLLLRFVYKAPASFRNWYHRHKQYQAQAKTRQGLIEFSEGYWQAAQTHLIAALPNTDVPLFNYLTAARTAQELGQNQIRDHYLREAQHIEPKANIAVKLTQAQLQISSGQWEQALATLQHLHDLAPKHPYVLKLLAQLYETVKDWSALLRLLPSLKKYSSLSAPQIETMQQRLYLESFQEQCKQAQSVDIIKAAFKAQPKAYQQDPIFIIPYCQYLSTHQDWQTANQVIKQQLTKALDDRLILLYTDLPTEEDKLTFAKSLLKSHPHSAPLHYCLGRLNLNARLFGQARYHLEQSLSINPQPYLYFYLGETLEMLESPKEAAAMYKQGLQSTLNNTKPLT